MIGGNGNEASDIDDVEVDPSKIGGLRPDDGDTDNDNLQNEEGEQ